jgi:hypothetical protein
MLNREFLSRIWGPEFTNEVHYLRTWVSRLRAKLDPDDSGELITTFPGIGYRMELPGALAKPAPRDIVGKRGAAIRLSTQRPWFRSRKTRERMLRTDRRSPAMNVARTGAWAISTTTTSAFRRAEAIRLARKRSKAGRCDSPRLRRAVGRP